ncbi:MAG TPA: AtpZ/AtpI family protein [Anaerolineales bacterium]|nr:AtpZ/AtpI family protein [Anaerolineales bacterium]
MRETHEQPPKKERGYAFNLALAAVAGQVGCLTVFIILVALFGGLWLDNYFALDSPVYTIGLMVASIPVTLVLMLLIVRRTTARLASKQPKSRHSQEESDRAEK